VVGHRVQRADAAVAGGVGVSARPQQSLDAPQAALTALAHKRGAALAVAPLERQVQPRSRCSTSASWARCSRLFSSVAVVVTVGSAPAASSNSTAARLLRTQAACSALNPPGPGSGRLMSASMGGASRRRASSRWPYQTAVTRGMLSQRAVLTLAPPASACMAASTLPLRHAACRAFRWSSPCCMWLRG